VEKGPQGEQPGITGGKGATGRRGETRATRETEATGIWNRFW